MILIKKLKFLPSLFFFEKDLDKMLKDLLDRKGKGVNPWIMSKNFKLLPNFFLPKNLDMMLDDVPDRKKRFSRLQKGHFKIVVNPHFSKRG